MQRRNIPLIIQAITILSIAYACTIIFLIASLQNYRNDIHKQFDGVIIDVYPQTKAEFLMVEKPRVFAFNLYQGNPQSYNVSSTFILNDKNEPRALPVHREKTTSELYISKRIVDLLSEKQKYLENSEYYDRPNHNPLRPYKNHSECTPMHPWQEKAFPTCNVIHEFADLTKLNIKMNTFNQAHTVLFEDKRLLAHGYFRDTYMIFEKETGYGKQAIAFKTLRLKRRYDAWILDRHRMDALVMDRMKTSTNIIDIYGYCGAATLVEFADGDMYNMLEHKRIRNNKVDFPSKLKFAADVANAIADLHAIDSRGNSSAIVHADIHMTQFVWVKDRFKLNDFNRCHFMYWNRTSDRESCPYIYLDYNAGLFRSPEEYSYGLQNEKIDVYSMGNIIFFLLEGEEPFESFRTQHSSKEIKDMIYKNGTRPILSNKILESAKDPIIKTMIKAINMCHEHNVNQRATAVAVRDFLTSSMKSLIGNRNKTQGS